MQSAATKKLDRLDSCDTDTLKVLLVDDDEFYLRTLVKVLGRDTRFSYDATLTTCGEDALDSASKGRFDLVLIDYNLPDMTGTECLSSMRSHQPASVEHPPAIICTAAGSEDSATAAVRSDADDYLPKEKINIGSLSRSIHNAVDKHRLRLSVERQYNEVTLLNEKLKKRNDEIKQFYHNISHEVKTPLAAAREFVSLVRDGAQGSVNEEQGKVLDMALASCDQITRHFKDLVDISRLELNGLQLDYSDCVVDSLIQRSVASCSDHVRKKCGEIRVTRSHDCPHSVRADANRVVQVLTNLMSNAIKYTESAPMVELVVSRSDDDGSICFSVADNGIGIDPEHHDRIFERLAQNNGQHSDCLGAGLGLGLSIAREIVALHQGTMWLESSPGAGSTFFFTIPQTAGVAGLTE